ncbi:unnamed protein product [Ixodes pacificus]
MVSVAVLYAQDCVQHCRQNGCSCDLKKGLWLICVVFSRAGSFVLCDIVARQVQLADPHTLPNVGMHPHAKLMCGSEMCTFLSFAPRFTFDILRNIAMPSAVCKWDLSVHI